MRRLLTSRCHRSSSGQHPFRPVVQSLESRAQPGGLLVAGLDLSVLGNTLAPPLPDSNALPTERYRLFLEGIRHGDAAAFKAPADAVPVTAFGAGPGSSRAGGGAISSLTLGTGSALGAVLPGNLQALAAATHTAPAPPTAGGQAQSRGIAVAPSPAGPALAAAAIPEHPVPSTGPILLAPSSGQGGPDAVVSWASYYGTAGADGLHKGVLRLGSLYVTGSTPDPNDPTIQDVLVARLAPDGTQVLNAAAVPIPGATRAEGHGIDVDAAGNMIVVGTSDAPGFLASTAFRLEADFQTVTWTLVGSVHGRDNGVVVDNAGDTFWLTGVADGTAIHFPPQCVRVAEYTDLSNPDGPTAVFDTIFRYPGFDGTTGLSLGVAPSGALEVAGTFTQGGNVFAGQNEFAADGSSGMAVYFNNPGSGSLNDVFVGPSGESYSTGHVNGFLLLAKENPGLSYVYAWLYPSQGAGPLNGNGIRTDQFGFPYVAGSEISAAGDADVLVARFASDGSQLTDHLTVGGSGRDVAESLDLSPFNEAYVVGETDSIDFPTTAGVFQPAYGGGSADGFAMRVSNFF